MLRGSRLFSVQSLRPVERTFRHVTLYLEHRELLRGLRRARRCGGILRFDLPALQRQLRSVDQRNLRTLRDRGTFDWQELFDLASCLR